MIADFRKKQKNQPAKQLLLLAGAIMLTVFLVLLIVDSVRLYKKRLALALAVNNLQQKIKDLQDKNNDIKEAMARENDDAYIEKVAREELDLQQPGEKVFSFIVPEAPPAPAPEKPKGMFSRFPNFLENLWLKIKSIF